MNSEKDFFIIYFLLRISYSASRTKLFQKRMKKIIRKCVLYFYVYIYSGAFRLKENLESCLSLQARVHLSIYLRRTTKVSSI